MSRRSCCCFPCVSHDQSGCQMNCAAGCALHYCRLSSVHETPVVMQSIQTIILFLNPFVSAFCKLLNLCVWGEPSVFLSITLSPLSQKFHYSSKSQMKNHFCANHACCQSSGVRKGRRENTSEPRQLSLSQFVWCVAFCMVVFRC